MTLDNFRFCRHITQQSLLSDVETETEAKNM